MSMQEKLVRALHRTYPTRGRFTDQSRKYLLPKVYAVLYELDAIARERGEFVDEILKDILNEADTKDDAA